MTIVIMIYTHTPKSILYIVCPKLLRKLLSDLRCYIKRLCRLPTYTGLEVRSSKEEESVIYHIRNYHNDHNSKLFQWPTNEQPKYIGVCWTTKIIFNINPHKCATLTQKWQPNKTMNETLTMSILLFIDLSECVLCSR